MVVWEYRVISCTYRRNTSGFFEKPKGKWLLSIDQQEYPLAEGLALLGQQGWELGGVQSREMKARDSRRPDSYYIFKRESPNG